MKRFTHLCLTGMLCLFLFPTFAATIGATASLSGQVLDMEGNPLEFANVVLYSASDSNLVKVETTQEGGQFEMKALPDGHYWLSITYVGLAPYTSEPFKLSEGESKTLPAITLQSTDEQLEEVVVTAQRPLVEVAPDKLVFNVDKTINAAGSDAFELLRKAPGVVVDNNDNISLLGRSGVQIYIDGKPSPLGAADLAAFLKSIQSSEIDAIEIITNPSARFDAEGNAGIINIKMKKNQRHGANANMSLGYSVGEVPRYNGSINGNFRDQHVNVFGSYSYNNGENKNFNAFYREQSGRAFDQFADQGGGWESHNFKAGADWFAGKHSTFGVLTTGYLSDNTWNSYTRTEISQIGQPADSLLIADNASDNTRDNLNFNLNYQFDNTKGIIWNIDADYGTFRNRDEQYQPNVYLDPSESFVLRERINIQNAPTDIDIYTFKVDHERPLAGGKLEIGAKSAYITTDNTFNFYDVQDGEPILNLGRSNNFVYDENINAAYISFNRQLEKVGIQAGLRTEHTHSIGDLTSFRDESEDERFVRDYLDWFPSAGVTYTPSQEHSFQLSYSRRINRPSYQDLNPFLDKLDELTFEQGNPFLRPEYANNIQLTHTFKYRFNTTLSFSHTKDLITRITDTAGVSASYITWLNLDEQYAYSLSFAAPVPITEWWSSFTNLTGSYTQNRADYGDGKTVDLSVPTFNIYSQHTFQLPWDMGLEVSGWYNSPSIWGGTFEMDAIWSIDAGIQKKIMDGKGNLTLGVSDIFKTNTWSGVSEFGALMMDVRGGWDSRRFRVNFTYQLGNDKVKKARNRKTGLEDEKNRIKSGN